MGSVQTTIKINPSLNAKLEAMKKTVDDGLEDLLSNIAWDLVNWSPVDTGAYVHSHNIKNTSSGGRLRSSENKPRKQDPDFQRYSALTELTADIDNLDPDSDKIVIRNRATHASDVENGWPSRNIDGYEVYAKIKAKYR